MCILEFTEDQENGIAGSLPDALKARASLQDPADAPEIRYSRTLYLLVDLSNRMGDKAAAVKYCLRHLAIQVEGGDILS